MTLQQLKYAVTIAECKSMNQAATELFMTQPALSNMMKELEKEIHLEIFTRTNRGIVLTPEGEEFLGYARQILEHYQLIEEKYLEKGMRKKKFAVSMQHYTFAVEAFMHLTTSFGFDEYEFAIHETKTSEVIEHVQKNRSELGVIYRNDFNGKFLDKLLREKDLEFIPLFTCNIYAYMSKENPLSQKRRVTFEDLQSYPCLTFEQGDNNSFYFAEEVLSTYDYKQTIKLDDRATMLNMMRGLKGYTLCSGIICEELNGEDYIAVPLESSETMTIGYIKRKRVSLSAIGERYVQELKKYETSVL